jgi:hypothetical protein
MGSAALVSALGLLLAACPDEATVPVGGDGGANNVVVLGDGSVQLADGAVVTGLTVSGGGITLPAPASVAHIGLPITSQLETLPLALEMQGFGQGRVKNVNTAHMRVYRSSGIFAGPSVAKLVEYKQRTDEVYGAPPGAPYREDHVKAPFNDYGREKLREEEAVLETYLHALGELFD